jgi:hypothetical protein
MTLCYVCTVYELLSKRLTIKIVKTYYTTKKSFAILSLYRHPTVEDITQFKVLSGLNQTNLDIKKPSSVELGLIKYQIKKK